MTETTTQYDRQRMPHNASVLYDDIEDARTRLGDSIDEIGQRLDVRARLKGAAQSAGHRVSEAGRRRPVVIGGASLVAAAVAGVAVVAWRRWSG